MPIIELTKENFDETVTDKDLVLLDFWAEWCGPCKAFSLVFAEAASRYPEAIFGQINIETEPELASDFQIRAVPTIMILRQNVVVFSESSVLPLSGLCTLIDQSKQLDMKTIPL
jgi:thioredoxin 1